MLVHPVVSGQGVVRPVRHSQLHGNKESKLVLMQQRFAAVHGIATGTQAPCAWKARSVRKRPNGVESVRGCTAG